MVGFESLRWLRDVGDARRYAGLWIVAVRSVGRASVRAVPHWVGEMTSTGLDTLISRLNGRDPNDCCDLFKMRLQTDIQLSN